MNIKNLLIAVAVLFIGSSFTGAGKSFPSLTLKDLKGNPVKTESFINNGKITVVSFFATWCKPCQLEMDNIGEIYGDWQEAYDMEMVAISVDNARGAAIVYEHNGYKPGDEIELEDHIAELAE